MYYQIIILLLLIFIVTLIYSFLYKRTKYLQELLDTNKQLLDISNRYEQCLVELKKHHNELACNPDFEERSRVYFYLRYIDLRKYIDDDDIKLLAKLGIKIEDRLYSEYDYDDIVDIKLFEYFDDKKIIDEEDMKFVKPLPPDVSKKDYYFLYEKMDEIRERI